MLSNIIYIHTNEILMMAMYFFHYSQNNKQSNFGFYIKEIKIEAETTMYEKRNW